jgi:pyruvate kinase
MRRHRHAKIVATVGPATHTPEMLKALFLAGVDTFRLNFSHGVQADHAKVHAAIRTLEQEVGRPIAILQDLQGPKIRVGTVRDGRLAVAPGESLRFVLRGADGDARAIPLPHPEIFAAVVPGQELLIDDGRVRVRVTGIEAEAIEAEVVIGGAISNRKGVNLPGTLLDVSPLTEKDRADLAFGLDLGVDWVALSFVQKPADLIEARGLIGDRAGIMTKVEKPQALDRIEDIIRLSDAVMVARGDLGVEIPHEDVPGRQKELIRACRLAVKPVVVATQMLDSMVSAPTPTRAEASDVATAIYDGADAVMLSAESATGRYPVEAVAMMDRIIRSVEGHKLYRSIVAASEPGEEETPPHAVATATAELAQAVHASAIVTYTLSGTTAARVARKRPAVPILALTPDLGTSRRLSLLWGTHSVRADEVSTYEEMVANATAHAVEEGFARASDLVVITAGIPFAVMGTTNNIRIAQIPTT